MANPICLSPLRFYEDISSQAFRKSYAYNHIVPLVLPTGHIPSFQFSYIGDLISTQFVHIWSVKSGKNIATVEPEQTNLFSFTENGHTIVMCKGFDVSSSTSEGEFYITIGKFCSDVFSWSGKLTNNADDFIKLQYKNNSGSFRLKGGTISFEYEFEFELYLLTELGKPEYIFEEEATKRLGYNFIESQVSKKVYKFNTIGPEYLCDAMRIIRLCDTKQLTYKSQLYDMLSFDMDVDWQTQGDLASITCEFETDNIIVNLGGTT